jgi:signal transduction histidine kinase
MTLATVKSGNYQLNKEEMNIYDLVNEIYHEYKLTAEKEKHIKIEYINELDNCKILNDESALNIIVKNIIDNAVKFTNEGAVIIRTFKKSNDKCTIEIKDTGIGIDNNYLDQLFEPFTQEEMAIDRSYDGNGLGLALAKEFATIINAEINVESEKGKGSKFTVILN